MGLNASAVNSFRQRDGSFSGKQKQKNQRQGNQGQNWGQNNFQPPINGPQPAPQSPWQNQNQGKNIDIMNINLPAQKVNPPVQVPKPGGKGSTVPLSFEPTQKIAQKSTNKGETVDLIDLN